MNLQVGPPLFKTYFGPFEMELGDENDHHGFKPGIQRPGMILQVVLTQPFAGVT